jgi:hypothetical protein
MMKAPISGGIIDVFEPQAPAFASAHLAILAHAIRDRVAAGGQSALRSLRGRR